MGTIRSKKSDAILNVGIFLGDIGVYNWALTKEQALLAIEQFDIEGIAILGGDVYDMQREVLQPNCDNWYCDRKDNEDRSAFVSRSISKARDYVTNYKSNRNIAYFFAIVPYF